MADKDKDRDDITESIMKRWGEPIAKGLSGMFLSTPYPDTNKPVDYEAPIHSQEWLDAYEEDRKKRGSYGILK